MHYPPLPPLSLGIDSGIPGIHAHCTVVVVIVVVVVLVVAPGRSSSNTTGGHSNSGTSSGHSSSSSMTCAQQSVASTMEHGVSHKIPSREPGGQNLVGNLTGHSKAIPENRTAQAREHVFLVACILFENRHDPEVGFVR